MTGNRQIGLAGVAGALAVVLVAGFVGLVTAGTDASNVAATEGHSASSRSALAITMRNPVESRAQRHRPNAVAGDLPAFGPSHDDETPWRITALVGLLPGMTRDTYEASGTGESHDY